jgi:competence protein ComEA
MAGWWITQGGPSGRLAEVDESPSQTAVFQVDLNSADWSELAQLPGIGPALAKRIVESRAKDGPFPDVASLVRVRGIGQATLTRIQSHLVAHRVPPASK